MPRRITALAAHAGGLIARTEDAYFRLSESAGGDSSLRSFVLDFSNGGESRLDPLPLGNALLDYDAKKRLAYLSVWDGSRNAGFQFAANRSPDLLARSPIRKTARYFTRGKADLVYMLREDGQILCATAHTALQEGSSKVALATVAFDGVDEIVDMASVADDALVFANLRAGQLFLEILDPEAYTDVKPGSELFET